MTTDELFAAFQTPGPEWRGKPFWAWNGRLDKAELLRQVHVMKEMGLGGFFMHSRVGLATEYLGDDWFECINACADEAQKLGMQAWLYDEDRWPSGTAGGLVTENPEYRMRFLRLALIASAEWQWHPDCLAAFACELADDGLSYSNLRRVAPGSAVPPGFTVLVFSVEEMAKSNFYNGYTYLDTMNRAATEAFLQSTHEKYVEKCGDRLGKSIKGIFTDEPHRGSLMTRFGQGLSGSEWLVPWTPRMEEHWEAAYSDDLIAHLPEIFLWPEGAKVHPTKWKYVELCLSLFIENYCKPVDDWCRAHNLILTGHFLHEDNLTSQVAMNGSMLRCYEHMEYPGMDLLTEGNKAFWVAKQLQSAGRQFGKPWLMSELYGCTGWQMGLEGHKQVGDWQALFGVNLRCHHLSWYTMEGEAKRDYPASILHQSAWWKDYAAVETYFARLGLLLSQGEPVCDVLVIHPVESVWAQIHPGWCNGLGPKAPAIQKLETQFAELFHWLQGAQIDFDYGDEGILAKHARVDSKDFVVGQMRYKTIVIGGCTTIRSSTLKLLKAFDAAGGNVIWAGEKPQYVDAVLSSRSPQMGKQIGWDRELLIDSVQATLEFSTRHFMFSDQLFCQMRKIGEDRLFFALNSHRENGVVGTLWVDVKVPEKWDCLSGERAVHADISTVRCYGGSRGRYSALGINHVEFSPGELKVFVLHDEWTRPTPLVVEDKEGEAFELLGPFFYSLDEPNALVLDTASWELVPTDPLTPARRGDHAVEVLKIDQAVRRHFGLEVRGGEMVQPWYAEKFHGEPPVLGRLTLRFAFEVEVLPERPLVLAMERPERFFVSVNGSPLAPAERGDNGDTFWIDACFHLLPIPLEALQPGENVVELVCDFRRDSDLEAIYLLGQFGVRLDGPKRTMIALPETLAVGDICEQGLPFYTGGVTYQVPVAFPPRPNNGEPEGILELPEVGGACVRIDGKTIPWPPYTAQIPPFAARYERLPEGVARNERGEVDITVVLTRRNAFGPLHLVPKVHAAYGPGHWITEGASWSDDYQLFASGLLAPPRLRLL